MTDAVWRRYDADPMAIRFLCPACTQPIEVDDPWASMAVACPYCRKTVTAPATSTLNEFIPVASPLRSSDAVPPFPQAADPNAPNRVAVAAFILACGVFVFLVAAMLLVGPHRLELEELNRYVEESKSLFEASNRFMANYKGVLPSWMVGVVLFQLAALGSGVASVVCGIIGLRRVKQRGFAVAALLICGGMVVFSCAGAVI